MSAGAWSTFLGVVGLLATGAAAAAGTPAACVRQGGIEFVCGVRNVEDLVRIPGRDVLIGTSYVGEASAAARLYAIDTRTRLAAALTPELGRPDKAYAACPEPLNLSLFHPHGIALRPTGAGRGVLYVVNHGGRESIELFAVESRPSVTLKWIGCVVLPDGTSGNGVTPLPDGGFAASKFFDTHAGNWIAQLSDARPTGAAFTWHPGTGFREIPGVVASGDNGIETSADGRWVFIDIWPEKRVLRADLTGGETPRSIALDFMPDNIRRAPDGSLLVGGHIADFKGLMACKRAQCPVDWAVARIDPATLEVTYLMWEKGTEDFEGVTGALEVGDRLWLSVFRGDRVGSVALPLAPLR